MQVYIFINMYDFTDLVKIGRHFDDQLVYLVL